MEKKKRITHIRNTSNMQFESETNDELVSFDVVDKILNENMVGYPSIESNRKAISLTGQPDNESALACSSEYSKSYRDADVKFKKFANTRKFPLMEKSQKILKQLKHNRCLPKPRAHLYSTEAPPEKKSYQTSKASFNKVSRKKIRKNSSGGATSNKLNQSVSQNNLDKNSKTDHNKLVMNKNREISKNLNLDKVEKNIDMVLQDSSSSDDEFENFVAKQKKEINSEKNPNKKCNKKNINTKKVGKKSASKNSYLQLNNSETVRDNVKCGKSNILTKRPYSSLQFSSCSQDSCTSKISKTRRKDASQSKSCLDDSRQSIEESDKLLPLDANHDVLSQSDENAFKEGENSSSSYESDFSVEAYNSAVHDSSDDCESVDGSENEAVISPSTNSPKIDSSTDESKSSNSNASDIQNLQKRLNTSINSSSVTINFDFEKEIKQMPSQSLFNLQANPCFQDDVCSSANQKTAMHSNNRDSQTFNDVTTYLPSQSSKSVKQDFIPFNEFVGTDYNSVVEKINNVSSDESDIEIIDVVYKQELPNSLPNKRKQILEEINNLSKSLKASSTIMPDSIANVVPFNMITHALESSGSSVVTKDEIEPNVLVEKIDKLGETVINTENRNLVKQEVTDKHDPVYVTNICHDFTPNNIGGNSDLVFHETNVKHEENEDDIIIEFEGKVPIKTNDSIDAKIKNNPLKVDQINEDGDVILIGPISGEIDTKHEKNDDEIIKEFKENVPLTKNPAINAQMKNSSLEDGKINGEDEDVIVVDPVSDELNIKHENKIIEFEGKVPTTNSRIYNLVKNSPSENAKINLTNCQLTASVSNLIDDQINPIIKTAASCASNNSFSDSMDYEMTSYPIEDVLNCYKKEFSVYEEIIKTEANLEAGLKIMELHQANKVIKMRSYLLERLKRDPCFNKFLAANHENFKDILAPSTDVLKSPDRVSQQIAHIASLSDAPQKLVKVESFESENSAKETMHFASVVSDQKFPTVASQSSNYGLEANSKSGVSVKQELPFLNQKCAACGQNAYSACKQCAKVFFCSEKCGIQFWNERHSAECGK